MSDDLTEEEVYENYEHFLSFKDLERFIEENKHFIDPEAKVVVQRVEDRYFKKGGWGTLKRGSAEFQGEVDEFSPAWCVSKSNSKIILIYMHY